MSIERITLSVPQAVARQIKSAAGESPVSAWVTSVIEEKLADAELERRWAEFYADVAPDRGAERKADAIFKRLTRRRRGA